MRLVKSEDILIDEETRESVKLDAELSKVFSSINDEVEDVHIKKLKSLKEKFKETGTLLGAFNVYKINLFLGNKSL